MDWPRLAETFTPILLAVCGWYIRTVATELRKIGLDLAVAVQRIEDHDRRITRLEHSGP